MKQFWNEGSIRKKILYMLLSVSLSGLLLSMAVSIYNLSSIRNSSILYYQELGYDVTEKSELALIGQMKQNIKNLVNDRSTMNVASTLGEYQSYAQEFAEYITRLYREPDEFVPQQIEPPQVKNGGTYVLQRYTTSDTKVENVLEEAALLGNTQYLFDPVIRRNKGVITTIYLATESGLLISYDADSDRAGSPWYDFKDTVWYRLVKERQQPLFTEVYKGAYNWGLMTTCAAPFYKPDGSFAGVVCIDLRLEDIHRQLICVDISENATAYVLDWKGDIIAGPDVDYDSDTFRNIKEINDSAAFSAAVDDMLSGSSDVIEADGRFYAYAQMDEVGWILMIEVPKEDVIEPVIQMRSTIRSDMDVAVRRIEKQITVTLILLVIVIFLCIVVIFGTSLRFTKKLVKPIQDMKDQVRIVSGGNLDAKVEVQTKDEIGELARGFNHMADSLKDYISEVKRVTADKERIGAELSVAAQIQSSMLPCIFPPYPDRKEFDIYASMEPAKEVGGDFYDFFLIDENHLALVMADVSGKGVPAALFMVIAKTLIKDYSLIGSDPADVFTEVNRQLCESNDNGLFVTAWIGIIEISTGFVRFTNAGHNPPLVLHQGGTYEYLRVRSGLVLAGMEGIRYKSSSFELRPGDALFLYTDGVTEAMNLSMDLYGEKRLKVILNQNLDQSPEELLVSLKADLGRFVGEAEQFDDITMLAFRYYGKEALI